MNNRDSRNDATKNDDVMMTCERIVGAVISKNQVCGGEAAYYYMARHTSDPRPRHRHVFARCAEHRWVKLEGYYQVTSITKDEFIVYLVMSG